MLRPLYVAQAVLLCTVQVIYKKFNFPCPFVDFAHNGTASGLNVSSADPGGVDDPSCVPKMANINSQVGPMHVPQPETARFTSPATATESRTYATVMFSMLLETLHDPSMEITFGLKHSRRR